MKISELTAGRIYSSYGAIYLLIRKIPVGEDRSQLVWMARGARILMEPITQENALRIDYVRLLGERSRKLKNWWLERYINHNMEKSFFF